VQVTARLDAASSAAEDKELEFWLDLRRVHVFDPESGENLTVDTVEGGDEANRQAEPAANEQAGAPAQGETAGTGPQGESGPGGTAAADA
jgi:multiple sugar transport system ATP-binding protein